MNSPKPVKTDRACPISKSNDAWLVSEKDRHGKELRNVMSVESGLIFVDPVPFENTEEFYKKDYRKSYKGVHRPKPKHVYRAGKISLERFSRLSRYLPAGANCLDAGSSSGEFVYLLNKRGFNAQGVEANLPYAEYSVAELDLSITKSPFSEFKTDEKFDLITMFHVLEHLEFPVRDLLHLGKFLKPGGKLVIEVPNILFTNMAYSHKWHPGHLFSFTDKTLSLLLEQAGFKTITCSPTQDEGNLWGVFERSMSSEEVREHDIQKSIAVPNFDDLHKGKWAYRFNLSNYFKFLPKILSQMIEMKSSARKSGKDILDELYKI